MPKGSRVRSIVTTLGLAALALGGRMGLSSAGAEGSAASWELDPDFGVGGVVTTDFPGSGHRYSWGYDSAVQTNGRTVVIGVAAGELDDAAVAGYLPDGALDPSFGDGGRVTIGPHALFRPRTVAFQDVGGQHKILLAVATTFRDPYRYRCSVIRLNSDGALDSDRDADPTIAFGPRRHPGGEVPAQLGLLRGHDGGSRRQGHRDRAGYDPRWGRGCLAPHARNRGPGPWLRRRRAGRPGGEGLPAARPGGRPAGSGGAPRVLVGGLVSRRHGYDWALWRLRPNGRLDNGFGHQGRTVTTMYDDRVAQSFEGVRGLTVKPDGGIVAVGSYRSWPDGETSPADTAVAVTYSPDGALDRDFGDQGRAHIPYDVRGDTSADDVTLDAHGRILFAGSLSMPTSGMFLVGGFRADGFPDARFGSDGFREFVVGGGYYTGAASVSLDDAGRLVMAGIDGDPNQVEEADRFAVVRMRLSRRDPVGAS